MHVVGDRERFGADFVHRAKITRGFGKRFLRREMIEIADVLARECLSVDDERDGVLQIAAERENRTGRRQRRDGLRR